MKAVVVATACAAGLLVSAPAGAAPALAGDAPATASSNAVGGKIPVLYDKSFAGYAAEGAITTAAAQLRVPRVRCKAGSRKSGVTAQVVSFVHSGNRYTYGAIEVECHSGHVKATAAIVLNAGPLQEIKESTVKVSPGDQVEISVKENTHRTSVTVHDMTSGTAKTASKPRGYKVFASQYGDGALDTYTNGALTGQLRLASFSPNRFSDATENGRRIGADKLIARYSWTSNGTAKGRLEAVASALNGKDAFTITMKHA